MRAASTLLGSQASHPTALPWLVPTLVLILGVVLYPALIDGLGRLQTMFRISLPLVWPGIVTAIVFVFVNSWNEFSAAFILAQQTNLQPLTVSMPRFLGLYIKDWQYLFTVAMIAIVPVVILFSFIERRLIGGLTAGSVK